MELYLLEIDNGLEYEDFSSEFTLVVAKDENEANEIAKRWMEQEYKDQTLRNDPSFAGDAPSYKVTLINLIDGYVVRVEKLSEGTKS